MTHPMAVEELQDDEAVEELHGVEIDEPLFAVIQHSYEEARARIHDLVDSSWPEAPDGSDQHPGTERIDMRLVNPPAVGATTPPTAAMSLAARLLVEQPSSEGVGRPGGERTEAGAAHGIAFPDAREPEARRARHLSSDLHAAKARVAAIIARWLRQSAATSPFATSGEVQAS